MEPPPPPKEEQPVEEAKPVEAVAEPSEPAEAKPVESKPAALRETAPPKPVIFAVSHAPDDPGPDEEPPPEPKKRGFRLFG
jgi:HemY protein